MSLLLSVARSRLSMQIFSYYHGMVIKILSLIWWTCLWPTLVDFKLLRLFALFKRPLTLHIHFYADLIHYIFSLKLQHKKFLFHLFPYLPDSNWFHYMRYSVHPYIFYISMQNMHLVWVINKNNNHNNWLSDIYFGFPCLSLYQTQCDVLLCWTIPHYYITITKTITVTITINANSVLFL